MNKHIHLEFQQTWPYFFVSSYCFPLITIYYLYGELILELMKFFVPCQKLPKLEKRKNPTIYLRYNVVG